MHRELKINYGVLEQLVGDIETYQSALSTMKQKAEKIWELLSESSGEAYEGLKEQKETILAQMKACEGELSDLHDLLAGYSYDMQSAIAPVDKNQIMLVDRNDIWYNMQSILHACDRVQSMVYHVRVPWIGTSYTPFADDKTKKKEEGYHAVLAKVQQNILKSYQYSIAGWKDELVKLYENKVIVYENTDDVYAAKVSRDYYPKYTSFGEGIVNVFEWLGDAISGITEGVIEALTVAIDGIGELLFGIGEFLVSGISWAVCEGVGTEPPEWAVKNLEETKESVTALIKDPMQLVDGIGQSISDTYEKEGIWYCAGYTIGTYAGAKGMAEGVKLVKGKLEVKVKAGSVDGSDSFKITDEIRQALTTDEDKAYFWSGLGKNGADIAKNSAIKKGCTTLENQIEVNNIKMPEWSFLDKNAQQAWRDVSDCYAQNCSGNINVVLGDKVGANSVFISTELDTLKANTNVKSVTAINPFTNETMIIYDRLNPEKSANIIKYIGEDGAELVKFGGK